MPANLTFQDGLFTDALACTLPILTAPFPRVNADYILTQDFRQAAADYNPLALNTTHPDFPDYYLVREDNKRALGGGMIQWTRTYAQVPSEWSDTATINFTFPQLGDIAVAGDSRGNLTKTVTARILYEYFLCAPGETYETPGEIPILTMFQPYLTALGADYVVPYIYASGSTPDITTYQGWIAAGTEIVAQDSIITPWQGNIYCRETRYIKSQ